MPSLQTRGQLESKIAGAITQFEREHLGRGPQEVRAWIIQDLIIVRLKRVLTPAEEKLARDPEGRGLVKEMRRQLIEGSRGMLDEMILTDSWENGETKGDFGEEWPFYRWEMLDETWPYADMHLLTIVVWFEVQGQEYNVHISTLAEESEGS